MLVIALGLHYTLNKEQVDIFTIGLEFQYTLNIVYPSIHLIVNIQQLCQKSEYVQKCRKYHIVKNILNTCITIKKIRLKNKLKIVRPPEYTNCWKPHR